ncbi:MAG: autotransporter domain-containing protein [Verrucomicrobiota bacterium]
MKTIRIFSYFAFLVFSNFSLLHAAAIILNADDAAASSSLNAAGNWSVAAAPSAGNTYSTNGHLLRTPGGVGITFAGDSLSIDNGSLFLFKGNTGSTTTVGNLILNGGTVADGTGATTYGLAGAISVNAVSGFDVNSNSANNRTLTISSTISGASNLVIGNGSGGTDTGSIILSGNNSAFTGGVSLGGTSGSGGGSRVLATTNVTLQIGNANALGTGAFTVNGGTVDLNGFSTSVDNFTGTGGTIVNQSSGTTSTLTIGASNGTGGNYQGTIADHTSGTGVVAMTKSGTGTITLSHVNTYTGATTINGGILRAGVVTTAFGSNSAVTLANVAGTALDLNNNSNTIGSLSGGGTTGGNVTLGSGTLTTGADNTSTTFAGVISGTGGLTKTGTGIQTLSGTNTATGTATVSAGTLSLGTSGTWAGNVIVNSSSTFKGRGSVLGALTINSGGTYSPGTSPGIQTVGSLTLNSGSNTIIEIDGATAGNGAGFHDQIQVTGAATINGGTLTPQTIFSGSSGYSPSAGQTFTILSAGSLTGQFTSVDNSGNPSGLTFIPQYTGTSVILLTSLANFSSTSSISLMNLNPSEIAIARSLDQFRPTVINSTPGHVMSDAEVIYQSLSRLTANQIPEAITQLSPAKLEAAPQLSHAVGSQIHSQIGRQLELRRDSNPTQGALSIYDRNGQLIYEPVASLDSGSLFIRKQPDKLSFFASVNGEQGEVKPSETRTDYDYWSTTAIYGGNYALSREWNLGVFTGYGHADTSLGGSGGKIFYNSGKLGGYVSYNKNDWFGEFSSTIGKGFYDTRRNISFLAEQARGKTEGWELSQELKLGKDLSYDKWTFSPSLLGRYSRTILDAYDETGSAARLHIGSMDQQSVVSGAGLTIQRLIPIGKMSLSPRVFLNYEREWIRSGTIDARFAAGGDSFRIQTDPIDPDQLTAGTGISWFVSDRLQWDLSYECEALQNDLQRQAIHLSCKFEF